MKVKAIIALAVIAIVGATASVAGATWREPQQWFAHENGHGALVCDKGSNGVIGPFASREACEAFIAGINGGGGDNGGGGNGGGGGTTTPATVIASAPSGNWVCDVAGNAPVEIVGWTQTYDALNGGGAFAPNAIAGNIAGDENVGAYHLACNAKAGTTYIDASGESSTENLAGFPGWYPVA